MCGITGIFSAQLPTGPVADELTDAVASLRHRGPDDNAIWHSNSGVALGHTRLSILDLTDHGRQPMSTDDGRYTIAFNGEIYNYQSIRARLESRGHEFRGNGDTETILHAFQEWGHDAINDFIGMFAIALWDSSEEMLTLWRDRMGVKPLHYGWDGKTLCFGSELKALRCFKHWTPTIDFDALGDFFRYGYISGERTVYKGVYKLRPGHKLEFKAGDTPKVTQYWSAQDLIDPGTADVGANWEGELEDLLIDAFQYRMVSDVPVGVFLSGGVDSSLVTALLAKHHSDEIHTFTIGFGESSHDESKWAERVAKHCGTVHTEYKLHVSEALEIAKTWGEMFDEPFGDSSGIPTYLVSRLAKERVKVVLSADGGDELFSGYNAYTSSLSRLSTLERLPDWVRYLSYGPAWLASGVCGLGGRRPMGLLERRLRNLEATLSESGVGPIFESKVSMWHPQDIDALIGRRTATRQSASEYPGDPAVQMSLWDIQNYLAEDILTKVDRTTMAVSIEGREPLLDHRIVEYALNLPYVLRRGDYGTKHALKSLLYRYVPRELVDRPKQGFAIPLENWLRNDLKDLVADYLATDRIREAGILDPKIVQNTLTKFKDGDRSQRTPLWLLLSFEMWREAWM